MLPSISDFTCELALTAVAAQHAFDAAWTIEDPASEIPRMRLSELAISASLVFSESRTTALTFNAEPVNISLQIMHGMKREAASSLSITVQQVPLPVAAQQEK